MLKAIFFVLALIAFLYICYLDAKEKKGTEEREKNRVAEMRRQDEIAKQKSDAFLHKVTEPQEQTTDTDTADTNDSSNDSSSEE